MWLIHPDQSVLLHTNHFIAPSFSGRDEVAALDVVRDGDDGRRDIRRGAGRPRARRDRGELPARLPGEDASALQKLEDRDVGRLLLAFRKPMLPALHIEFVCLRRLS
jgi:hypothetical protein